MYWLHAWQGFGVAPWRYASAKASITRAPNASSTLSTKKGIPRICATRRASSAASGEQHERFASQPSPPNAWVRIQTPTTSAVSVESTPPLMAATIRLIRPIIAARTSLDRWRPGHGGRRLRRLGRGGGGAEARDAACDGLDGGLDVRLCIL